jgi:hypothetical protein
VDLLFLSAAPANHISDVLSQKLDGVLCGRIVNVDDTEPKGRQAAFQRSHRFARGPQSVEQYCVIVSRCVVHISLSVTGSGGSEKRHLHNERSGRGG